MIFSDLPAELFAREIPQSQSAIRCTGNQVSGVGRERTDPDRAATWMLQDGLDLAADRGPDHRGGVRRARGEELSTGAEAATVDAVAVSRQRWEGHLGEVTRVVDPESFVPRTRGQQFAWEGAPVDVIPMVL